MALNPWEDPAWIEENQRAIDASWPILASSLEETTVTIFGAVDLVDDLVAKWERAPWN